MVVNILFFFVTYFLVDYESINSTLNIFFGDDLEIKRFHDFTMYVVYVCALISLFKFVMIVKLQRSNTLICVVFIKAAAIETDILVI